MKLMLIITGLILLLIAGIGFVYPINDDQNNVIDKHDFCQSGVGKFFNSQNSYAWQQCHDAKLITYGIIGSGLIGIIFVIVGAVVPSNKKT
jgi:hypothetical protein